MGDSINLPFPFQQGGDSGNGDQAPLPPSPAIPTSPPSNPLTDPLGAKLNNKNLLNSPLDEHINKLLLQSPSEYTKQRMEGLFGTGKKGTAGKILYGLLSGMGPLQDRLAQEYSLRHSQLQTAVQAQHNQMQMQQAQASLGFQRQKLDVQSQLNLLKTQVMQNHYEQMNTWKTEEDGIKKQVSEHSISKTDADTRLSQINAERIIAQKGFTGKFENFNRIYDMSNSNDPNDIARSQSILQQEMFEAQLNKGMNTQRSFDSTRDEFGNIHSTSSLQRGPSALMGQSLQIPQPGGQGIPPPQIGGQQTPGTPQGQPPQQPQQAPQAPPTPPSPLQQSQQNTLTAPRMTGGGQQSAPQTDDTGSPIGANTTPNFGAAPSALTNKQPTNIIQNIKARNQAVSATPTIKKANLPGVDDPDVAKELQGEFGAKTLKDYTDAYGHTALAGKLYSSYINKQVVTPQAQIAANSKKEALDNTLALMTDFYPKLGLLNSLGEKVKLQLVHDGNNIHSPIKMIVGNVIGDNLSSEETKLLSDYKSLIEHINTLRQPLGATGFRSIESYLNLISQAGAITQPQAVTRNLMENTMRALLSQRKVQAKLGNSTGFNSVIPLDLNNTMDKKIAQAYVNIANGDKAKARKYAKEDGYKF